jgi:hypothetical protein
VKSPGRPFRVEIADADVADLRERLRRTRWPEPATVPDWSQGVPLDVAQNLAAYWADGYDMGRLAARLNAYPQFLVPLDGLDIHVLHARSPHPDAGAHARLAGVGRGVPRGAAGPDGSAGG